MNDTIKYKMLAWSQKRKQSIQCSAWKYTHAYRREYVTFFSKDLKFVFL
jgi:hypothetical protein